MEQFVAGFGAALALAGSIAAYVVGAAHKATLLAIHIPL
jgi:hypothetical protein